MARIRVFEGGSTQRADPRVTPHQAFDHGKGAVGQGLQKLGQGVSDAAKAIDEIEDVRARVEANRLAIEHDELARQIARRVKETLGEGAEEAAEKGALDLEKGMKAILQRASPRARQMLEPSIAKNSVVAKDTFLEHGYREKITAFESSSVARIQRVVDTAADEDDEDKALAILSDVREINEQRAQFFGKGEDWLVAEDRQIVSRFYKSRALKLAVGRTGSAYAAIEYATKHRQNLTDEDYNALISAYSQGAIDDAVAAEQDGVALASATTTVQPGRPSEQPARTLDPKAFFKSFVALHEGSAYVIDSNGAGVKYGFNEAYNGGVNVRGLTLDKAADLFARDHWKRSGADKLPPALAAVHADTFFLNERQAAKFLKESGGDVDKYLSMRRAFLNGLARSNPGKFGRYQKGWNNRTDALADFAGRQGGATVPAPVSPGMSLEDYRAQTMARTDIGLTFKRKLIERYEQRRADARQERAIVEEEASRALTGAVTALGQNFTDVKQLPQDAWLRASPATRQAFTEAARQNKENKPVSADIEAQIGFLETFAPEKLAEERTQKYLLSKGVPASRVADLARTGGRAMGTTAGAQPQPVERGTLESYARPAFEAAGHFLWTTETSGDGKKKQAERQAEAEAQVRLLGFLREASQTWAINNPGKKADEATIKGWIATALRRGSRGIPLGTMSNDQTVIEMSAHDREEIKRRLRAAGLPVTVENVALYYRRMVTQRPR